MLWVDGKGVTNFKESSTRVDEISKALVERLMK